MQFTDDLVVQLNALVVGDQAGMILIRLQWLSQVAATKCTGNRTVSALYSLTTLSIW